jgi:hypothetical protein
MKMCVCAASKSLKDYSLNFPHETSDMYTCVYTISYTIYYILYYTILYYTILTNTLLHITTTLGTESQDLVISGYK